MRTKSTQVLYRSFIGSYWIGECNSAWICHDGLKAKVMGIGGRIREIRIEALKNPTEDTFEVTLNEQGFPRLKEFPHTYLMTPFQRWLKGNYRQGRKHIQVTYVEARKQ